jgi:hypothetical protein
MTRCYTLIPFKITENNYAVEAKVQRIQNLLVITFSLYDDKQEVFWPEQETNARQDFLWESTCFEAFISSPDQPKYFELNLSPSLAWNLYQFCGYRTPNSRPPQRATDLAFIDFKVINKTLHTVINLSALNLADQEITLGLTAVIKTATSLEYLAVHHPKSEADFHDSQGWTIRLLPDAPK